MIDHRGPRHDPRVALAGGVPAALRTQNPGLLLRPPDEQHPLSTGEPGQMLMHHMILTLPLHEIDQRHVLLGREPTHPRVECLRHRRQRGRGGDPAAELTTQVPDHSQLPLQLRNVGVQIHTVDALHLEDHMIGKHISRGTR